MSDTPMAPSADAAAPETSGASFAALLLRGVPREDIAPYSEETRTALAAEARSHFDRPRASGSPAIELRDVTIERDGRPRDLTILEISNDDAPFLLDSTLALLIERNLEPILVAHPILDVERDLEGRPTRVAGLASPDRPVSGSAESFIHIHLSRLEGDGARADLVTALRDALGDVASVARDAAGMREQLAGLVREYRSSPPPLPAEERAEAESFLEWLDDRHFVLMGMRASRMPGQDGAPEPLAGSGLGLLRDPGFHILKRGGRLVPVTPELQAFMDRPQALMVTKASVRSRVLRRDYLDYIGAKLFSPSGKLWGELAMVGLFTGSAYTSPASETPYLRGKVRAVLDRAGFDPASFNGRALLEILESFPRDELFQIDIDTLSLFAAEILRLREHPRIRALCRIDRFDRFVSCLIFLPRDRDDAPARERIGAYLASAYAGRVSAVYPPVIEGGLSRTHYIIGRDGDPTPAVSQGVVEAGIAEIARTWGDRLREALGDREGGARGRGLAARYAASFGAAYREAFDAEAAMADIARLERLGPESPRAVDFYRRPGEPESHVGLKLFSLATGLPLSERVPLLERLGFRVLNERTHRIAPPKAAASETVWLHDMTLERASGAAVDIPAVEERLEEALLAILGGAAESDGFNKLVLEAGLTWRDAATLRTLGRYLRQLTIPYGQEYLATVLAGNGECVAAIMELFRARFDPALTEGRFEQEAAARARADALLGAVTSLDDDRILRRFLNLVQAAVRTNAFQARSAESPIAFKFDCAKVAGMPKPRPLYEIFMNGPRVEALHLRFGKVARGGLRWSDRPQDFRTEVLGLVKAQQVKNAVIVPVGAKGGFFPKRLPPASDRAAWLAEGTEAYRSFVGTMLDLTDNLEGERVIPPAETVRHDGDDPYLVVAADKGTATFSDVANAISIEHGHWLGDAFASGGSQGYDHKAMGITARGAWEAVKRHFREMDIDIQAEPVTVAGVGDMSGDVFGNGMLLSRAIKLVAAFDHRDIFLDPDPDPAASWAERKRLYDLPRSSWADYDRGLISPGGGVFPRSAKSIALSPEARAALGAQAQTLTPAELMSVILRAPVGLLWFGGIGTYVRASEETDEAAGDRANDPIRITGAEIRAKVVGEGANLGLTQRGRIEAARAGVRLNTDAIDNSAGVNTSDVEVNIKIALATPERDGRLDPVARKALLTAMTDEVAALVLRNNYLQTLAISLSERRGAGDLGFMAQLMNVLERSGRLDRAIEFLPDEAALAARRQAGEGLTRPELAVLLAYAKLALHDELLGSKVPDDPYLGRELDRYFPQALRQRFPDAIAGHRLRREIISTQLSNAILNRLGPAGVVRLADDAGADATTIAAAYAAARDAFDVVEISQAVDGLDGRIPGARQLEFYAAIQDLMLSRAVWFVRNVDLENRSLDDVVGQYRGGLAAVASSLGSVLPAAARAERDRRLAAMVADGVPEALGARLTALPVLLDGPDIVLVAGRTGIDVPTVAAVHYGLDELFDLTRLVTAARAIPVDDHYDRLARDRAVDAVAIARRQLTAEIVGRGGEVASWREARAGEIDRTRAAVDAISASGLTVSKLTVAAGLLADLAKG